MEFEVSEKGGMFVVSARLSDKWQALPALWLRERAPSPDQIDLHTRQRLVNPHQFDDGLYLTSARDTGNALHLAFSDGYESDYSRDWLASHIDPPRALPAKQLWKADLAPVPKFSWPEIQSPEGHLAALEAYLQFGFIILADTPTELASLRDLASHFGHIRATNFGEMFEVRTQPNPNDLAYQPVALGPHTDNPYREPTPGIQLLHCLVNETSGGLSTLVDSLYCARILRESDPAGYQLLAELPVRFTFDDRAVSISAERPILALDPAGELLGVHYSPRLDWLPLVDEESLRIYHRARKRLAELFSDPACELRFRLNPGECMMFDNNRVLHGRTAFDPNEGHRHLQGCYIDRDGPENLYRRMRRDGIEPAVNPVSKPGQEFGK